MSFTFRSNIKVVQSFHTSKINFEGEFKDPRPTGRGHLHIPKEMKELGERLLSLNIVEASLLAEYLRVRILIFKILRKELEKHQWKIHSKQ